MYPAPYARQAPLPLALDPLPARGTRVVSSSTYETMHFWLPLLAAALCAYLGERVGTFYGSRDGGTEQGTPAPR